MLQQVMTRPGEIVFQEVPIPPLKEGQVLVKIKRIGICGSDIHVFAGMAEIDLAVANDHELDIKSTMMYRHEDYLDGIRLVKEGRVQLKPLISKSFAFQDYLKAYQYIDENRETTMKVIINVQETS